MAEIDDFWDIASLMPKKKKTVAPPYKEETEPPALPKEREEGVFSLPLSIEEGSEEKNGRRAIPPVASADLSEEYAVSSHPFLKRVRIYRVTSPFHFYHGFREAAAESLSLLGKAKSAPFVSFFSYSPQYSQLSSEQRAYYLYFRDSVYRGDYIKTDKNYILLLVYEILNAPKEASRKEGALLLARIWSAYRGAFPQMDRYMAEWLPDYCLLYRVPLPLGVLAPFLSAILRENVFREFYLGALAETEGDEAPTEGVLPLISYLSHHDPYKSRFSQRADVSPFLFHIEKAVSLVFSHITAKTAEEKNLITTKTREAFCGAVFAGAERYRIEVVYQPIFASLGMSEALTAAVKHAENRLRMYFRVKSRLLIREMDRESKRIIDAYFDGVLPQEEKSVAARPEYEAQYDAPSVSFSAEEAEEIENASWMNTRLLVDEEELLEAEREEEPKLTEGDNACVKEASFSPISKEALALLVALFHQEPLPALSSSYESLAEEINDYFSDTMGDVVLEINEAGLAPIADYQEEVEALLGSISENE